MIEELRPFIITSWHGHRNDPDIPAPVREVWSEKFRGRRDPRGHSNVDLAVLDPGGEVVHSFDGFPKREPGRFRGRRESLARYTERELRKARRLLGPIGASSKRRAIELPDLEGKGGIRVFVRLLDDRMTAYRAPVVEVVPLNEDDWKPLALPEKERTVRAARLEEWLSQVYPPGVMERTDPRTKEVYRIETVDGELSLSPAGSDGEFDYAVLRGRIRLRDDGPDGFSYEGTLRVVLAYRRPDSRVRSLKGVFEGIYPRPDRHRGGTREAVVFGTRFVGESRQGGLAAGWEGSARSQSMI